jgi:hypothetical protein
VNDERLTRREFTRESVLALLSGVVITITGCSGGDGYSTSPTPTSAGGGGDGINGSVSANHGHAAFVSNAQISAGNNVSLDIRGTADHSHRVDLTGAELMQIGNRQRVVKASTNAEAPGGGDYVGEVGVHRHNVTFN